MEAESIFYRPDSSHFYFPKAEIVKDKRTVFFGNVHHNDKEKKFLQEFRKYLLKVKSDMNPSDEKVVLFGYDKEFKPEDTYKALKMDEDWRKTNTPIELTPEVREIL